MFLFFCFFFVFCQCMLCFSGAFAARICVYVLTIVHTESIQKR